MWHIIYDPLSNETVPDGKVQERVDWFVSSGGTITTGQFVFIDLFRAQVKKHKLENCTYLETHTGVSGKIDIDGNVDGQTTASDFWAHALLSLF